MAEYVEIQKTEHSAEVCFAMTNDKVMALMEKLMDVRPGILMNSHDPLPGGGWGRTLPHRPGRGRRN